MIRKIIVLSSIIFIAYPLASCLWSNLDLGDRPQYLIGEMSSSSLKSKLKQCDVTHKKSNLSISHCGAPMRIPEHTRESYEAAANMGAGIIECDVTFTKDKELVCRHSQSDLHTTTNILATNLAKKCTKRFVPANQSDDGKASAECRTSDITLEEFLTLKGKMDEKDEGANTVEAYMKGWNENTHPTGELMTHAAYIELVKSLGSKFTPELKKAAVEMPFNGMSQKSYAKKMIDEYRDAWIDPSDVFLQSFNLIDIKYWIQEEFDFGKQAVYLVEGDDLKKFNKTNSISSLKNNFDTLKSINLNYIAPPIWALVDVESKKLTPSNYAKAAKEAGLKIITWSLERSGSLD